MRGKLYENKRVFIGYFSIGLLDYWTPELKKKKERKTDITEIFKPFLANNQLCFYSTDHLYLKEGDVV